jgi:hypothetical protein
MSEEERLNNMPMPFSTAGLTPDQIAEFNYLYGGVNHPAPESMYNADYGDAQYREMTGQNMIPDETAPAFGNYGLQMGPHYEAGLEAAQTATAGEGQMPAFGSAEYQQMMGHAPNSGSQTLPKFNPASGADWMRGLGLFAKGAILGAPKQAGPAPANPQSNSGKNVSKESTYNQGDYWGWLFNS